MVMIKPVAPGYDFVVFNLLATGVTHVLATTDNGFVRGQIVEARPVHLPFHAISTERWYEGSKVVPQ